jgi:hypothetical protein
MERADNIIEALGEILAQQPWVYEEGTISVRINGGNDQSASLDVATRSGHTYQVSVVQTHMVPW